MGLVSNTQNANNVVPESIEKKENPALRKAVPVLTLLLILFLIAGLIAGGYWVFVNRDELKETFFPTESAETVPAEKSPAKPPASFFRKLINKNRAITVRGTLLGEKGGTAVLLNKKIFPKGAVVNGMRIVEITNQSIVVEYGEQRRRVQVGETFDPDEQ